MTAGKRYTFALPCIADKKRAGTDSVLKIIVPFRRLEDWIHAKGCSYRNKLTDICW